MIQLVADDLLASSNAVAITARLSHDIEAKALAHPSAMTFLQQRIAEQLRQMVEAGKLSEVPEFVLVIEQIHGDDTHLHGLINGIAQGLPSIREAFRLGCGQWPSSMPRQHQVTTSVDPDDGWTSYMLKDRAKVLSFARKMQLTTGTMGTTFDVKPYTVTLELRRRVKKTYEADRAAFLDQVRSERDHRQEAFCAILCDGCDRAYQLRNPGAG